MEVANTPAYYNTATITAIQKFYSIGPRGLYNKTLVQGWYLRDFTLKLDPCLAVLIQTGQKGGQQYSDTSRLVFPGLIHTFRY
jgi:hypothetical protein